ncbi:O-antigen polymerase [Bacillus sp. 522_BSPC]|uniref:O-antigen polymerase n=1 Tax=Bacillus sp. 522_BSPC TaxID=1579338 RepID=UPI0006615C07|nr:O-antigen polymerase [Bacillus sp. 522_BSPC]
MKFTFSLLDGGYSILLYVILIVIFKRRIKGFFDPFNIYLIIYSFSFVGILTQPNNSIYYNKIIFCLIALFLGVFIGSLFDKTTSNSLYENKKLSISYKLQLTLSISIFIVIILNFVVNFLMTGNIPLINGGYQNRYQVSDGNRILTWLYYAVNFSPIALTLSEYHRVKNIAKMSLGIVFLSLILTANKASFLTIVLLFTNIIFVYKLFGLKIKRQYFIALMLVSIFFIIITPFYASYVTGNSSIEALNILYNRLFLSFDQLIMLNSFQYEVSNNHLSMLIWYFAPFLKVVGIKNDFDSAADYFVFLLTGLEPGTYNGPVNNLILELIVTHNSILYMVIFVFLYSTIITYFRFKTMNKIRINFIDYFFISSIVVKPFQFFVEGYLYFVSLVLGIIFYLIIYIIYFILYKSYKINEEKK